MRIVLASLGTLGDLFPFLALGEALRERGHSVAVACAAAVRHHVAEAGLDAVACYPDLGPEIARQAAADFDHWPKVGLEPEAEAPRPDLEEFIRLRVRDLAAACHGADLLIHNSGITGESIAAEIAGIPALRAVMAAERLWNPKQRHFLEELEERGPASDLEHARDYFRWHRQIRRAAGLPEVPAGGWRGYFAPPGIAAVSSAFVASLDTSGWNVALCGFWFHEPRQWRDWQPDPELAAFMERRPIVVSLSSQPLAAPARAVEVHRDAARLLGQPLLVQSGWAALAGADADDVLFRGALPQDWLFSRAACVVNHGGAGTIARSLRNACPVLVEPWGNDQFFNGWMVLKGGWGAAVNPKKIGAEELASVIERKVLTPETRERVALMGARLKGESGIENALNRIELQMKQAGASACLDH